MGTRYHGDGLRPSIAEKLKTVVLRQEIHEDRLNFVFRVKLVFLHSSLQHEIHYE